MLLLYLYIFRIAFIPQPFLSISCKDWVCLWHGRLWESCLQVSVGMMSNFDTGIPLNKVHLQMQLHLQLLFTCKPLPCTLILLTCHVHQPVCLCEFSWFNTDAPQGGCASSASWSRYIGSVKILWVWGRKISAQTTQLLPRNQTAIISFTVQPRSTCLNMICQRCTRDHAGCIVADLCLDIKCAENRKTHLQHWNWIGMNSILLVVPWIFLAAAKLRWCRGHQKQWNTAGKGEKISRQKQVEKQWPV